MSILERINDSADLKKLNIDELEVLAEELRTIIIDTTTKNGGHLSSNLGVVETTLALHYVFDLPTDKLIFDVGHQCYTHKILSGRKDRFSTIRMDGGISGFPNSEESEYDAFTTGHAGTAIAAGLGLCKARDVNAEKYRVISMVGDGAFANGLNLEALSASSKKPSNYLIVLNDNGMSISSNRNGLYRAISKGTIKLGYVKSKSAFKKIFRNSIITKAFRKIKNFVKRVINKGFPFDRLGLKYVGVIDGHNIKELVNTLTHLKNNLRDRSVILHVKTIKGKGLNLAEEKSDIYHGVGKNLDTYSGDFSNRLGEILNKKIDDDKSIIAITAGMKDGTGLKIVEEKHPDNFIDVGIAEEYAVTLSAGMASGGLKPVVGIYSTFLQRSYDQILHDVCIQNLPVVFCLDRAGFSGADGTTHQGLFDLSYLSHIPNMTILAPASTEEMEDAIDYAFSLNSPVAIRYPKNNAYDLKEKISFTDSLWQVVKDGKDVCILAVGPNMLSLAEKIIDKSGKNVMLVNARSVKPLDEKVLESIKDKVVVTLEENSSIGGFGSLVLDYYNQKGFDTKVKKFGAKDQFSSHGKTDKQMSRMGIDVDIVAEVINNELASNVKPKDKAQNEIDPCDLLEDQDISINQDEIRDYVGDKVVLVTGGGGSIGSEICRQIAEYNPKQLIIFDSYENNAYATTQELKKKYKDLDLLTLIGSVCDDKKVENLFRKYKPQVIFHSAAHKHVPLMETSPSEAVKNNVIGTFNVADNAGKYGAERFILISTEKASHPSNVMAVTKRIGEMVVQTLNAKYNTLYASVRFGNVLGSNGSVIPIFEKQIRQGGPVTVTHKDMARYFTSIPGAVNLILQCGAFLKGGEIFTLDSGKPVKIYDLAEKMIKLMGFTPNKDVEIKIAGLRPGETLVEVKPLEEGLKDTLNPKIFITKPIAVDEDTLFDKIKALNEESYNETDKMLDLICELVPSYKAN